MHQPESVLEQFRGTTIVSVRRNGQVALAGDGQVSMGNTTVKGNATKVRRLYDGRVLAGFAGGTADAFTLFERFESKLSAHSGNLTKAAVDMAKDWRTDRMLRRLEALLLVADSQTSLMLSGTGDVTCGTSGICPRLLSLPAPSWPRKNNAANTSRASPDASIHPARNGPA